MIDQNTLKSLEDLHRLKNDGIITEEDFERSKQRLLFDNKPAVPAAASWAGASTGPAVDGPVARLFGKVPPTLPASNDKPSNPQAKECGAALRELLGDPVRIGGRICWRVPIKPATAADLNISDRPRVAAPVDPMAGEIF